MFQFAEKPSSVYQIYKQSFDLYKNTFSKVWYLILINLAIINFIQLFAPKIDISAATNALSNVSKADMSFFGIYVVVGFVLSVYFVAVVMHRIYHLATSTGSIINSYMVPLRKLIFILITTIVSSVLMGIGLALWVIPGVFLMFLFMFCLAAILFEDKKVFGAIKRSCQLVWKNWWHTFSVFVPIAIIGLLFMIAMVLVLSIFPSVWLITGAFAVFFVIVGPLFFSVYLVQYNDLKVRKKA